MAKKKPRLLLLPRLLPQLLLLPLLLHLLLLRPLHLPLLLLLQHQLPSNRFLRTWNRFGGCKKPAFGPVFLCLQRLNRQPVKTICLRGQIKGVRYLTKHFSHRR